MAGIQDFGIFEDDFVGDALATPWDTNTTGAVGTPTATIGATGGFGELNIALDNTDEIEAISVDFGDKLVFAMANRLSFETRVKIASVGAAAEVNFGLISANAARASVGHGIFFSMVNNLQVLANIDDASTDTEISAATIGKTLAANTWATFKIDASDLADIKLFVDVGGTNGILQRVATSTKYAFSNPSASLKYVQPWFRIDKASGTTTETLVVDYVRVMGKRY